ncbi:MAG: thiamine-phosphate kinase [Bacteroidales bacterium]|nr:thiamine-phosphate kinase [Bacteroidales bacterium]
MRDSEFGFIAKLAAMFPAPEGVRGIGDDCAVIPRGDGRDTLVSTDLLTEGVHFLRNRIPPRELGWKTAAVNLSDIAAMGGTPTATFLSLAIPKDCDDGFLSEIMAGYADASRAYAAPLLGGDTCASSGALTLNVTVLGECPHGHALLRSGARPGDTIYVTGTLGESAAGWKAVQSTLPETDLTRALIHRHYHPVPRIAEGREIAACEGAGAAMDLSDGLASDLRHILKASGCGAGIDVNALPLSAQLRQFCKEYGTDPLELALCGGEDYELLFTLRPGTTPPVPCTAIGTIHAGSGLVWKGTDRDFTGFTHF